MKPDRQRPIAVEDLLRLKRAERPAAEFWSAFDQKLRAKQLAALVERRPWWHSLPSMVSDLVRPRVVFGTAAALAVVVVVVREYRPSPASLGAETHTSSALAISASQPVPVGAMEVVVSDNRPEPLSSAVASSLQGVTGAATAETNFETKTEASAPVLALADLTTSGDLAQRPAFVSLTSTLSAVETKNPARLLALNNGLTQRPASTVRTAIDPMQQMTPPGELRRARFSTAMVAHAVVDSTSRGAERQANRLVDDGAFNAARRFGARGDRVELKF
ncbi:MAG: hypothetical protein Q8N18_23445 [Opitutaceae bacterium]|nr:hypothetical protein [Opitutaceae bacterium]